MTPEQFIAKQRKRLEDIKKGIPLAKAAANSHARQVKRIFEDGIKSNGARIGKYNSSDPLYVNTSTNAPKKLPPKGKTGKTKFKSGKNHKTSYFRSYREFRKAQGRESRFVNLVLFGDLQSDYVNGLRRVNNNQWVAQVKRPINADKIAGNEKRFGRIFDLTKEEKRIFIEDLKRFTTEAMQK